MTRFLRNYIDGRWVASRSTEFEEVMNPATEEALANVPLSSKAETAEAVKAADAAFQTWKKFLFLFADVICSSCISF